MGAKSSSPQTQTTTTEPPKYLLPYLQQGAEAAQSMYGAGGTPVTPFSPQTEQALAMTEQRALSGSPVTQAAQGYATKSLNGGFMGQNPFLQGGANPYLDATFNQAAQSSRNVLESEFARSGRNINAAAPARADMLSNLATNIYGGAYENDANRRFGAYQGERQLQQNMIPFAGSLAAQDYGDLGQLATVGAQREDLAREQAGQPGFNLDQFLARLQGFPGGTTTNSIPMERNRLAGALGGGMMGNQMFGGWGALGGALLGGAYG